MFSQILFCLILSCYKMRDSNSRSNASSGIPFARKYDGAVNSSLGLSWDTVEANQRVSKQGPPRASVPLLPSPLKVSELSWTLLEPLLLCLFLIASSQTTLDFSSGSIILGIGDPSAFRLYIYHSVLTATLFFFGTWLIRETTSHFKTKLSLNTFPWCICFVKCIPWNRH